MLRISGDQLRAIGQALAVARFEDEMTVHLRDFAPSHSKAIGDDGVRRSIRFGVERAKAYGVTNPGLLRLYVELMFMFGGMFDTDPLQPWAGEVLRDMSLLNEATKMNRLYDAMLQYINAVNGPERSFALQALRNLKQVRLDERSIADLRVEQRAIDALAWIYPERCAYLGDRPLRQLFWCGAEVAARHGLATDRGIVLVTGMMFTLGHGFAEDPLFPWVQAAVHDPSIKAPAQRVARLERWTNVYLDRALENFERRRTSVAR